ncbi:hypothetical protein N7504_011829 [Penicillium tannophilum]|nr:hypothetical protein N7504_011829 [Penicillium tannophilum]
MFSPGAKLMQSEFGFQVEILTIITIASLGFVMGQSFVPPLSEVFGRVPVYRVSSILYLGFTAGCARSTHVAEFLCLLPVHWPFCCVVHVNRRWYCHRPAAEGGERSCKAFFYCEGTSWTDIIDIFRPETPASAMGALTIIRNMTGAFLPLAAPSLYAHPDMGWGNSVIVFITIAFIPIPVLSYWKEEWLLASKIDYLS